MTVVEPSGPEWEGAELDRERKRMWERLTEISTFSTESTTAGKFWASDSESDYEDLGDADQLATRQNSIAMVTRSPEIRPMQPQRPVIEKKAKVDQECLARPRNPVAMDETMARPSTEDRAATSYAGRCFQPYTP